MQLVLFRSRRQAGSNSTTQPNSLPSNRGRYFAVEEEAERTEERKAGDIPAADKHRAEDSPAVDIPAADKHPSDNLPVDNLEVEALQSEADLDYNNSSLVLPLRIKNRSPFSTQQKPISIPSMKPAGIQQKQREKTEERGGERVNGEDSEGLQCTEKKNGI